MRKLIVLLLLCVLLYPVGTMASVYGTLKGKITGEDGKGLKGATVLVEGTTRGTYVREADGSYIVANISPGKYVIKFTFTGLQQVRNEVRISADQTLTMDVVLKSGDAVRTAVVDVVAGKMIRSDDEGSKRIITNESIQKTATSSLAGVIAVNAGIIQSDGGFSIRGSRAAETQIRVDGIDASNQFTGGFGVSGSYYYPMVSTYAIEESQVISGGFQAEYGDVSGGVVSSSIQTGRTDRYDGWIRWRTDVPALFGSQSTDTKLIKEGTRFKAIESGEGAKLLGSGEHKFEFGTGGPLPFIENSTFFLSGSYLFEKYGKGYDVKDPIGNTLGNMPDDRTWSRNITPKFKFGITKDISLTLGASYGVASFESSSWGWLYNNNQGWVYDKMADGSFKQRLNSDGTPVLNGIPERIEKQNVQDQYVTNFNALITHNLKSSFYELRIGYSQNNDEASRRVGYNDPSFFGGFEKTMPTDNYKTNNGEMVPGHDRVIDQYTYLSKNAYTKDGYLLIDLPQRNPLTGYYEGSGNTTGSNNPYGIPQYFASSGGGDFSFRHGSWFTLDGSYTNIFDTGEFNHTLKTGFLLTLFDLTRSYNGLPYDGNPFFDVYSEGQWGGNLYVDNESQKLKTDKAKKPTKLGLFIQDQVKFKDIIISGGLRLDYFNPNSDYRLPSDKFISIESDSGFAEATSKFQVSPRINVSYPITESSNLRISYGMYFQMPQLQYMYDNFNVSVLRGNVTLGDPNMKAQRTNQYEVAYSNALTETFAITVTAYYKDIYDQLGVKHVFAKPTPYTQYTTADYGSSRGVELNFSKAPKDNFSFEFNYSLASITGSSPYPESNAGVTIDPYTNLPTFPLSEYPLPWDIRHYFKSNLRFFWQNDQGPSIGGIQLLENTDLILTSTYRTGTPYTRADRNGNPISEINSERQPSLLRVDAKISKMFYLKDIFGENAGQNSTVEFFIDIVNILNRTAAVSVYSTTGDPLDDGRTFDKQVGDFGPGSYYKKASLEQPGTYAPTQYDTYGNRLYNEAADFDKNGIVTQAEVYESYFKYIETLVKFRNNFQAPRTVFFGMMFRF